MIWAGQFEKLLEVIRGQPHLALKITLGSGNELLIGVTDVLVIITLFTTIGGHNSLGPLLWPPPTAPDAPPLYACRLLWLVLPDCHPGLSSHCSAQ
jgi:hypothetical protein